MHVPAVVVAVCACIIAPLAPTTMNLRRPWPRPSADPGTDPPPRLGRPRLSLGAEGVHRDRGLASSALWEVET
jgi:hypothetical protein